MYICVYVFACVCMYLCMCLCMYVCMHYILSQHTIFLSMRALTAQTQSLRLVWLNVSEGGQEENAKGDSNIAITFAGALLFSIFLSGPDIE